LQDPVSKKKTWPDMVVHTCNPSYLGHGYQEKS
jgi:hypothetical protein